MAPADLAILNPHTCSYCRRLVIDIRDTQSVETSQELRKSRSQLGVVFDFTYDDLLQGAAMGCTLCKFIEAECPLDVFEVREHNCFLLCMTTRVSSLFSFDVCSIEGFEWFNTKLPHQLDYPDDQSNGFKVFTTSDNAAAQYVCTRPINMKPASNCAFGLAHKWFTECHETHNTCQTSQSSYIPSRLIEIQREVSTWSLKLGHITGQKVSYAALSYCWGGNQPTKTTIATLNKFSVEIPYSELPATIQDAIITTSELGLKFLWVDCLCIIQDDLKDKAKEIAQMPRIYSSASVTIAASGPRNVHEGFLNVREVTKHPKLVFELPFRCPDGNCGSVTLFRPATGEGEEPLDERAWPLQERILSTRILEFATLQTRWKCPQIRDEKGYTDGWREQAEYSRLRRDMPTTLINRSHGWSLDTLKFHFHAQWQFMVETYTLRALQEQTDRILAISGIAEHFSAALKNEYIAGLWLTELPGDLLWTTRKNSLEVRPTTYQGPSWSWVAVNGAIDYGAYFSFDRYRSQIISHMVVLTSKDALYGAVDVGLLKIKGRVRTARWLRPSESASSWDPWALGVEGSKELLSARVYPDALEEEFVSGNADSISVHLLDIGSYGAGYEADHGGLVLRKLGNGCYSRLGLYRFLQNGKFMDKRKMRKLRNKQRTWFDQCEPEIITLV